ncbi:hypothetical protein ACQ86G_18705 [Roseateles chitinivorans]|uniref:hypothetical protein n=1 Tax=Roseateles chitinivorans TaxID=2917965 RepID=UPI003D68003B
MRSSVAIQISRFVDEDFPGFIECVLVDAFGKSHVFIEKASVVTTENLVSTSSYPCPGAIDCEVVGEWTDDKGHELSRVSIERPWSVESTEGLTEFVVSTSKLRS